MVSKYVLVLREITFLLRLTVSPSHEAHGLILSYLRADWPWIDGNDFFDIA